MTATFTDCYIIEKPGFPAYVTYDRKAAASSAAWGCTVWHIQDDVAPRDVTEDLAAEDNARVAAMLAMHGIKPREYEHDEAQKPRTERSQFDEHAIGWENV